MQRIMDEPQDLVMQALYLFERNVPADCRNRSAFFTSQLKIAGQRLGERGFGGGRAGFSSPGGRGGPGMGGPGMMHGGPPPMQGPGYAGFDGRGMMPPGGVGRRMMQPNGREMRGGPGPGPVPPMIDMGGRAGLLPSCLRHSYLKHSVTRTHCECLAAIHGLAWCMLAAHQSAWGVHDFPPADRHNACLHCDTGWYGSACASCWV